MSTASKPPFGDFLQQLQGLWQGLKQAVPNPGFAGMGADAMGAQAPWSSLFGARDPLQAASARLGDQAGEWMSMFGRLAEQMAGQQASPSDIASAWKTMLKTQSAEPFSAWFRQMNGAGAMGVEALSGLGNAQKTMHAAFDWPAFGLAREQQERWQALARASHAVEQASQRYYAQLAKAGERAFAIFETLLAERAEPGRQIDSARGLFDLWIDAAEQGYAEVALSPEFRHAYGELVNAQMRQRAGMLGEVDAQCRALGLPTRSELDGSHRKVTELQREVRRLAQRLAALEADPEPMPRSKTVTKPVPIKRSAKPTRAKPTPAPSRSSKSTAKKTGVGKPKHSPVAMPKAPARAADKMAARKPAAKKPAAPTSRSRRSAK